MDQDWYYGLGDDTRGPISFDQLLSELREIPDWREIQVWCGDFDDWRLAKDVHQIAFQIGVRRRGEMPKPVAAQHDAAPAAPAATNPARRKMLLLIAGGTGVALLALGGVAVLMLQPFTPALERAFARAVNETKPTLPKRADESTSLMDVTASATRITYQHVWDGPRFAIPGNLGALMKGRKLADICATMKEILDLGGTVEYSYRSQSALYIASFEVTKADCG